MIMNASFEICLKQPPSAIRHSGKSGSSHPPELIFCYGLFLPDRARLYRMAFGLRALEFSSHNDHKELEADDIGAL